MKLNLDILTLALVAVTGWTAGEGAELSVEARVASQAVELGIAEADLNWQASAEVGFGDFYVGAWSLAPLEEKGSPYFFDERYEFYIGKGLALADTFGLDVGATRYVNPNREDTTEAYLGVFAELGTIAPSLYIYRDFDLDRWVAEAAATVSIPLELLPVDGTVRLGQVEGAVDYGYWEVDLIYPVELGDTASLSFGLHYADNDYGLGVPDSQLFGSAALRLQF